MTTADDIFSNKQQFINHIKHLRNRRKKNIAVKRIYRSTRKLPGKLQRQIIFDKTGGRCHICGGKIGMQEKWQADHILAFAHGGSDSVDNYLPSHKICNNYRWNYEAEEFQWIIKLGIWLRTQIEKESPIGLDAAEKFINYEVRRDTRRVK